MTTDVPMALYFTGPALSKIADDWIYFVAGDDSEPDSFAIPLGGEKLEGLQSFQLQ